MKKEENKFITNKVKDDKTIINCRNFCFFRLSESFYSILVSSDLKIKYKSFTLLIKKKLLM